MLSACAQINWVCVQQSFTRKKNQDSMEFGNVKKKVPKLTCANNLMLCFVLFERKCEIWILTQTSNLRAQKITSKLMSSIFQMPELHHSTFDDAFLLFITSSGGIGANTFFSNSVGNHWPIHSLRTTCTQHSCTRNCIAGDNSQRKIHINSVKSFCFVCDSHCYDFWRGCSLLFRPVIHLDLTTSRIKTV